MQTIPSVYKYIVPVEVLLLVGLEFLHYVGV